MVHNEGTGEFYEEEQLDGEAQTQSPEHSSEAPPFDPSTPDEPLALPQKREVRDHRDSTRVPHIMPEEWQRMSMDKRLEAIVADELRRDSVT